MKKRSNIITIISSLFILGGAVQFIFGQNFFVISLHARGIKPEQLPLLVRMWPSSVVVSSLLFVVAGGGLIWLQEWARCLALLLTTFWVMWLMLLRISSSQAMEYTGVSDHGLVITLICGAFILWYFLRPSVKAQFVSKITNR